MPGRCKGLAEEPLTAELLSPLTYSCCKNGLNTCTIHTCCIVLSHVTDYMEVVVVNAVRRMTQVNAFPTHAVALLQAGYRQDW